MSDLEENTTARMGAFEQILAGLMAQVDGLDGAVE